MLKKILYISPGPNYNPHDQSLLKRYEYLSKYFCGYIFTTTSEPEDFWVGNFRFLSMKFEPGINSFFRYRKFCHRHAQDFLEKNGCFDLVTTYDPLKSGLIGASIAKMHGAPFAPEVNGVYTSPAEWLDEPYDIGNQIKKRVYPLIMLFVLKRAQGIRLLFPGQIDAFRNVTGSKVVHDFRRWVDTSRFVPIREDKEVFFAGFPFKRKGVDVLIAAFKQIAPKYPEWKLKILGWFPNDSELKAAIGGHAQIYRHPPVLFHEMPEHIGSCAILVLPSRSEAMGRVLLEAMSAGKPRIASNVDGIPTIVEDGRDGLLCEPGDIDDLAQKLDLLMGNPELRKKLGNAARERAKKEFTFDAYMSNLIRFYNAVIASV
jgi:glycosyltransferase involved in cell wall biosynthesis